MFATIDPATDTLVEQFAEHDDEQVTSLLERAAHAQRLWPRATLAERTSTVATVGRLLSERRATYAALITLEMGKPVTEALAEIDKCALTCEFYAANAASFIGDEQVASSAADSRVVFDPLGLVLAVMPWNYPFWQVVRFAAPALCAGNGAVLKHANNVPRCALAIEAVFRDAGAPEGLVTSVLVDSSRVRALIDHPHVAAVTLTGSTPVGKLVAAQAGSAMKKQVLELGGSDPFIVLADADVDEAARVALRARFQNAGQSCICAKRFIVEEVVADRFAEALVAGAKSLRVGDPGQPETEMGPMARRDLRDALHDQVVRSVDQGARLLLGGKLPGTVGAWYPPTVLDEVEPHMAAGAEETFGPVASILRVSDADAAIELANATEFGLGAALWTRDIARASALARAIDAGAVFINGLVASDPRLPFGGIKQSGYGRELGSYGIREFTNIKTVWVGPAH